MTKYKIIKNNDEYIIEIKGHSNFATQGKDIVCASISTAIYMTRNILEKLEPSYNISNNVLLDDGYAKFICSTDFVNGIKILENLEFTLNDLESQFPNYIKKLN